MYDNNNRNIENIKNIINDFENLEKNNKYHQIRSIDNKTLFNFILIIIGSIVFARFVTIKLSHIFFITLALTICYLIYSKKNLDKDSESDQIELKRNLIIPVPNRLDNYPDLIDILYTTRDFHYINPPAYNKIVYDLDNFIQLYEQIMKNKMVYPVDNTEVAIDFARSVLNNFHSLIYNLSVSKKMTEKYHKSIKQLHLILNSYMIEIIDKSNEQFDVKNINYNSKFYNRHGPRGFNYYSNKIAEDRFEIF